SLGMHIDSSMSMRSIWENPAGNGAEGVNVWRRVYGKWDSALVDFHWDHVLFEPYLSQESLLGDDKEMIGNFINYTRQNPANLDTVFYVYQVWPQQTWIANAGSYSN